MVSVSRPLSDDWTPRRRSVSIVLIKQEGVLLLFLRNIRNIRRTPAFMRFRVANTSPAAAVKASAESNRRQRRKLRQLGSLDWLPTNVRFRCLCIAWNRQRQCYQQENRRKLGHKLSTKLSRKM